MYNDYMYLVLHFPVRTKYLHKHIIVEKEVDFVVGKKFIITTKYDTIESLHNFSKIFETNSILDKNGLGEHAGFVFYYMVKSLYRNALHDLELILSKLLTSEKHVFNGEEKQMVQALSEISRELIDFRQITRNHSEILNSLHEPSKKLFGPTFEHYIDSIKTEFEKTHESIGHARELLSDLRVTNDSLLSTKQNETIKTLTIMAFITFPLSLIADLFSMNTAHAPIIGGDYDFEIIFAIMLSATEEK